MTVAFAEFKECWNKILRHIAFSLVSDETIKHLPIQLWKIYIKEYGTTVCTELKNAFTPRGAKCWVADEGRNF
jgi:hypothetical protein